jgi:hypothetical protein
MVFKVKFVNKIINFFNIFDIGDSTFSEICLKNAEFSLNKKNLTFEDLFEINELKLLGLVLSFYTDVIIYSDSLIE